MADEGWRKTGEPPPGGHNGGPILEVEYPDGKKDHMAGVVVAFGTLLGFGSAIYFNRESMQEWLEHNNKSLDDLVEILVNVLTEPPLL